MEIKKLFRNPKYPIMLYDENGNKIYEEDSDCFWEKREYDENGNLIYYRDSDGYRWKSEYDKNGNQIYYEKSDGFWVKREFDENGNEIYFESSYSFWWKREYDENGNQNPAIKKLVDSEHNYDFLPITYKDVNGKDWDERYYQRIQSKGV